MLIKASALISEAPKHVYSSIMPQTRSALWWKTARWERSAQTLSA
jgi:hypothetical protein